MCYANIVGVDNQKLRITREAELFREGSATALRGDLKRRAQEN